MIWRPPKRGNGWRRCISEPAENENMVVLLVSVLFCSASTVPPCKTCSWKRHKFRISNFQLWCPLSSLFRWHKRFNKWQIFLKEPLRSGRIGSRCICSRCYCDVTWGNNLSKSRRFKMRNRHWLRIWFSNKWGISQFRNCWNLGFRIFLVFLFESQTTVLVLVVGVGGDVSHLKVEKGILHSIIMHLTF